MIQIKQVVIYGHKLHSHTHSYIHNGFYIAFKHLGYNTYYFDDNDDVSSHDFSNTLFITEHQVNKKIPLRNDCLYLTHYIDEGDYVGVPKENIIILKVSLRDFYECDKGKNLNYVELNYDDIKHEYHALDNDGYNCLYMYWATDLLPEEIDKNMQNLNNMQIENKVHFVGLPTHIWRDFYNICVINNIPFIRYGSSFDSKSNLNVSVEDNMKLIQKSMLAPALQDNNQVECKYIPCRIFKNISYGKMGITNNKVVDDLFDNQLLYDSDINNLIRKSLEFELKKDKNDHILQLMKVVRDKHTYINRVNTIAKYMKQYTIFFINTNTNTNTNTKKNKKNKNKKNKNKKK